MFCPVFSEFETTKMTGKYVITTIRAPAARAIQR
jgi:hypothetical protein